MITLYGMGSPNVVKVYIALEELRLPYAGCARLTCLPVRSSTLIS